MEMKEALKELSGAAAGLFGMGVGFAIAATPLLVVVAILF